MTSEDESRQGEQSYAEPGLGDYGLRAAAASRFRALSFDPTEYAAEVAACGLNEAESLELLRAIWEIMVGFVEIGLPISSLSLHLPEDNSEPALDEGVATIVLSDIAPVSTSEEAGGLLRGGPEGGDS